MNPVNFLQQFGNNSLKPILLLIAFAFLSVSFNTNTPSIRALVIGVTVHDNKDIEQPILANKDANAFKDFLTEEFGIREDYVKLLLDKSADINSIKDGLFWLEDEQKKKKAEMVVIYFSGIGNSEGDQAYLLAHNSNEPKSYELSALSIKEIKTIVDNISSINNTTVMLVIDICNSKATEKTKTIDFLEALEWENKERVITVFPCSKFQDNNKKIGSLSAFNHYFVRGLAGVADKDHDKIISLKDIETFITQQVKDTTNNEQSPNLKGDPELEVLKYKNDPIAYLISSENSQNATVYQNLEGGTQKLLEKTAKEQQLWEDLNNPDLKDQIDLKLKEGPLSKEERKYWSYRLVKLTNNSINYYTDGNTTVFKKILEDSVIDALETTAEQYHPGHFLRDKLLAKKCFLEALQLKLLSKGYNDAILSKLKESLWYDSYAAYALTELGNYHIEKGDYYEAYNFFVDAKNASGNLENFFKSLERLKTKIPATLKPFVPTLNKENQLFTDDVYQIKLCAVDKLEYEVFEKHREILAPIDAEIIEDKEGRTLVRLFSGNYKSQKEAKKALIRIKSLGSFDGAEVSPKTILDRYTDKYTPLTVYRYRLIIASVENFKASNFEKLKKLGPILTENVKINDKDRIHAFLEFKTKEQANEANETLKKYDFNDAYIKDMFSNKVSADKDKLIPKGYQNIENNVTYNIQIASVQTLDKFEFGKIESLGMGEASIEVDETGIFFRISLEDIETKLIAERILKDIIRLGFQQAFIVTNRNENSQAY